jgi:hypothetical protein
MKHYVVARTTDNSQQNKPLEKVLTLPLNSKREAERWLQDSSDNHAELIAPNYLFPNRKSELVIVESET